MVQKVCSKCGREFDATQQFFHKSNNKTGLRPNCKECQRRAVNDRMTARRANHLQDNKEYHQQYRLAVLNAYCGGTPKCKCCGEANIEFLTLDHTENDGSLHRKVIGIGGLHLYRWAKKNGYPNTLQVLCRNCNWAKHAYGECPHQRK